MLRPGRRPLQVRLPNGTRGSVVLTDPVYSEFESTAIRELIRRQSVTAVAVGYLSPRVLVRSVQLAYVSCTLARFAAPADRRIQGVAKVPANTESCCGTLESSPFRGELGSKTATDGCGSVRPVSWPAPTSGRPSYRFARFGAAPAEGAATEAIWLILPVVICLSQRLSHACLSVNFYTVKLRMAH